MIYNFLQNVNILKEKYNAIQLHNSVEYLIHPFWSIKEIKEAQQDKDLKNEWNLKEKHTPFYGDWHDLFCIDTSSHTPSIIYINDGRDIIHHWKNTDSFLNALCHIPEGTINISGIIDKKSWLDF